jgi:hypothetical protein
VMALLGVPVYAYGGEATLTFDGVRARTRFKVQPVTSWWENPGDHEFLLCLLCCVAWCHGRWPQTGSPLALGLQGQFMDLFACCPQLAFRIGRCVLWRGCLIQRPGFQSHCGWLRR